MDDEIDTLIVYDGHLVAGGQFTLAGGVPTAHVAQWDGNLWSTIGDGISGGHWPVLALTVYQGDLVAAGQFTSAGGAPSRWDRTTCRRWLGATE